MQAVYISKQSVIFGFELTKEVSEHPYESSGTIPVFNNDVRDS
jgi:hypothetical protein